ncbi:DUF1990 family protein [Ruicaihuangia caeni]|uniref:DUF1990 family protein n=1 Tax=Ruicaihuangia caeni TaxID=3042517 RepID=A0AAW6T719_9MICO|nr:DUF1990 family protein [Klugiella sp. YN-L-19]MDI2097928.1 DUF1990 family protein [Klugiella sp. YN-L-19]
MPRSTWQVSNVSYGAIGASQAPDLLAYPPKGFHAAEFRTRIGHGEQRFRAAVEQALTWQIQQRSGIRVRVLDVPPRDETSYVPVSFDADGAPIPPSERAMRHEVEYSAEGEPLLVAGTTATLVVPVLGIPFSLPTRVVFLIDEPNRKGFATGTMRGHPLSGEESFVIEQGEDGAVWIHLRMFWRPGSALWRPFYPLIALLRKRYIARYLRALQAATDAAVQAAEPEQGAEGTPAQAPVAEAVGEREVAAASSLDAGAGVGAGLGEAELEQAPSPYSELPFDSAEPEVARVEAERRGDVVEPEPVLVESPPAEPEIEPQSLAASGVTDDFTAIVFDAAPMVDRADDELHDAVPSAIEAPFEPVVVRDIEPVDEPVGSVDAEHAEAEVVQPEVVLTEPVTEPAAPVAEPVALAESTSEPLVEPEPAESEFAEQEPESVSVSESVPYSERQPAEEPAIEPQPEPGPEAADAAAALAATREAAAAEPFSAETANTAETTAEAEHQVSGDAPRTGSPLTGGISLLGRPLDRPLLDGLPTLGLLRNAGLRSGGGATAAPGDQPVQRTAETDAAESDQSADAAANAGDEGSDSASGPASDPKDQ